MNTRDLRSALCVRKLPVCLPGRGQRQTRYRRWDARSGGVELAIRMSHYMPAVRIASMPAASELSTC